MHKENPIEGLYGKYIKRIIDFIISLFALVILSPILLIFTIVGAIKMRGNPFFVQERPGKDEKIFKLIKFRTMTNRKDGQGQLLPDDKRLTKYGRFLRSTSIDELPELINIMKGDMSIVGPRPLLVQYLPLYSERERKRHQVRPGITGWAQINGRNSITWEEKFELDICYVEHVSCILDIKIFFRTIAAVWKREGINSDTAATMEAFTGHKDITEHNEEDKVI